ncbi:hypothetical protein SRB5_32930 [Streptomyces sp. RB5]|uniref:Cobyrinic acid a,c-diamide synthase n=1 Tax=Streptomyces smaragdinus TaxID=2585196 RepID=A0A7K0CI38_9ACTN|nr:hypothetical protein [Streptomyces smaragdinus]MQY13150.1 hypothetical protein [Streptomyces smaragdinus]
MSRRVSLPGADELFRTTGGMALQSSTPGGAAAAARPAAGGDGAQGTTAGEADGEPSVPAKKTGRSDEPEHSGRRSEAPPADRTSPPAQRSAPPGEPRAAAAAGQTRRRGRGGGRRPSGRERHDEKITVYVSAEELIDLEQARLVLRGEHGLAVDRGRIVREAVAVVLADLESRGEASILVRRLRGR